MYCIQFLVICVLWFLQRAAGEAPEFRILAPPFVCPKDKDAVIEKPDNTVITLQTDAGADITFTWTVRWCPLHAPTQRFTLALWRTVRNLERQLNGPQAEPGVYVIDNTVLLSGVIYVFNVTASSPEDTEEEEKSFDIDNMQDEQKLLIERQSEMFSILLVGGQMTYTDIEYILEALVTVCNKTQDYYFAWTVTSGDVKVDVSDVKGSRLEIKANTLTPGLSYDVLCEVFKYSNGEIITENGLPFNVLHRNLNVNFNIDVLVISVATPFKIQTNIRRIDYLRNELTITWECSLNGDNFDDFHSDGDGSLIFPSGLPKLGEYLVTGTVAVLDKSRVSTSTVRIVTVEPQLPIIEVEFISRLVTEGRVVNLKANISEVVPGCTITWFFAYDECLSPTSNTDMEKCTDDEHGIPISAPLSIYSLEENFLSELADYSNETGWKTMEADIQAAPGTARVVAECVCNKVINCTTEGTVYAEVKLNMNEKPGSGEVMVNVAPETGTALETIFRISTRALVDLHPPMRYTFYCDIGNNESLALGSYLEHLAVETLLPYVDGGTSIWVQVCDSLGACSAGAPTTVELAPGEARTVDALIEDVQAHVMRCEIGWLRRLAASAIITYINTDQTDAHIKFTAALLEALRAIDVRCTEANYDRYTAFMYWLATAGVDTSDFV